MSRAKVQTSVMSATLSGIAVDDGAGLVAGDRDHLRDEAHRELRAAIPHFRAHELGLVDRDEAGFGLLLVLLAIADHGLEAVIDFRRQQILQRTPIAIGKGQHDHLIGAAGAAEEMLRIERGILWRRWHRAPAPAACRVRPGPSSGRSAAPLRRWAPAAPGRSPCPASGRRVVRRALDHVARGAIIRRPLTSGALSEDIAQPQEDEDRQRQEDDGVNIHVAFAF